jgi:peptidoglycan hydrolase-like protein with peptidoglycan-binding domain
MSLNKIHYGYAAFFVASLMFLAGIAFIQPVHAATYALLTAQIDYGQTSTNVTNLQTFLASSPTIYPQGRITGYFGPLTKSAVMNFQAAYGLPQVGRVGPATLAKINGLIMSGIALSGTGGTNYNNTTIAPAISNIVISPSNTSTSITWSTDEGAKAMVYYSATPFQLTEANTDRTRPSIIGGSTTQQTTSYQNYQSATVSGLQPHTSYYYMLEVVDADGNYSYTWPAIFTTNQ